LADGHHDLGLRAIAEYYGEPVPSPGPERLGQEDAVRAEVQMLAQKTATLCRRFLAGDMSEWQALEVWFNKRMRTSDARV